MENIGLQMNKHTGQIKWKIDTYSQVSNKRVYLINEYEGKILNVSMGNIALDHFLAFIKSSGTVKSQYLSYF